MFKMENIFMIKTLLFMDKNFLKYISYWIANKELMRWILFDNFSTIKKIWRSKIKKSSAGCGNAR